jgi:hypothetical protein
MKGTTLLTFNPRLISKRVFVYAIKMVPAMQLKQCDQEKQKKTTSVAINKLHKSFSHYGESDLPVISMLWKA